MDVCGKDSGRDSEEKEKMKNKLEEKLDAELKLRDVPYQVHHFIREYRPFTAITIVDAIRDRKNVTMILDFFTHNMDTDANDMLFTASNYISTSLRKNHIYGYAFCSLQDQFNRQRGRIIAKGRLLKHLKETAK